MTSEFTLNNSHWLRTQRQIASSRLVDPATEFIEAATHAWEAVARPEYAHTRRRDIESRKHLDPALYEPLKKGYVLAVACSTQVRINHGHTPVRADTVAARLPEESWHRQSAGAGAKGPRYYDWAWRQTGTGDHRHLLVRRNRATRELAFYLCRSPAPAVLSELIRVAGTRWCVEECSQAAKGQGGLDHYQVRSWTAWHRHITLAMLALAFLTAIAATTAPTRPDDPNRPERSHEPIHLTVPEIRHLLAASFTPPTSPTRLLHWSNRRRLHQAMARRSHYRRRLADAPSG